MKQQNGVLFAREKAIDFQYVYITHKWRRLMHTHKLTDRWTKYIVLWFLCSGEKTVGVATNERKLLAFHTDRFLRLVTFRWFSLSKYIVSTKYHNEVALPLVDFFNYAPSSNNKWRHHRTIEAYAHERDEHTWDNQIKLWFLIKNCQLSGINR